MKSKEITEEQKKFLLWLLGKDTGPQDEPLTGILHLKEYSFLHDMAHNRNVYDMEERARINKILEPHLELINSEYKKYKSNNS